MIILILGMILILLSSYFLSKFDILNPVFLCCAAFLLSIFSAYYNIFNWAIHLSPITIGLILCSLTAMVVCSTLVTEISFKNSNSFQLVRVKTIKIEDYKFYLILLIGIAAAYFYLKDVIRIAKSSGYVSGSGLTELLTMYRKSHFDSSSVENNISRVAFYLIDIYKVMTHLITYVAINNLITAKNNKDRFDAAKLFSVTLLYAGISILGAARFRILQLFTYIVIVYFMLYKKKNGWKKRFKIKTILMIILAVFLLLTVFVALRSVIGRETDSDPIYYITSYMGGSIELLDLFIKDPVPPSDIWGKESFYMIYSFLGRKLHIEEWCYTFVKEFRMANGYNVGNVYSALRCFYYDFGFLGCVLASGLVGAIYTYLYKRIGRKKIDTDIDLGIVAYGFIFYAIALYCINYYFDFVSPSYIKTILFFIIGKWFLVRFKIRIAK
ncbi:MAG: oligosaccharide repeat unit polymerase [Oscillospiraceae bacterium]|nr:oligosaccharide repeat unit polymerase [Oscillospiraceae bacterium]